MTEIMRRGRMAARSIVAAFTLTGLAWCGPAHAVEWGVGGCVEIRNASQLQAMKNNLASTYCLMKDIDAGSIANFIPVGDVATPFTGRLYGNGHVIRNLTIDNSTLVDVGLFGVLLDAVVQDFGLVDADVSSSVSSQVGALVGRVQTVTRTQTIQRVFSTGRVRCTGAGTTCFNGGLIGIGGGHILDAWSSAAVIGVFASGGLIGAFIGDNANVRNSYATGDVTCAVASCEEAGGFTAQVVSNAIVLDSYATGRVSCDACILGGFTGSLVTSGTMTNVYATGAVVGGTTATVGGLIGITNGVTRQCFAAGPVQGGATAGGLIGELSGTPTVTNCYWDTDTTGKLSSAAGTSLTTDQLRANLPTGFAGGSWGITRNLSYPFLIGNGFSSNLATLVRADKIYTALPLMQSDESQYIGNPKHTNNAALATVYTMVARAIGQTVGETRLDNVKVNRYFWNDTTQTTRFRGPIKLHARLGAMHAIPPAAPLSNANVIGKLGRQNWVVLRGRYRKPNGAMGTHYMLATLFTKRGTGVALVIANDPFTGEQVAIDPVSKRVVMPRGFPLAGFKVNGYATITNIH